MNNAKLISVVESIRTTAALIVVTAEGTFNSKTGESILPHRVTVEARNWFLKDFCERANSKESETQQKELESRHKTIVDSAFEALEARNLAAVVKLAQEALDIEAKADEPRFYYRLKENLDLRTVAEKRAEKKALNAQKKAQRQQEKETRAAAKLVKNVTQPASQPTETISNKQTKNSARPPAQKAA